MGLLGRYIDGLPARARDRLITAQDWCVAAVTGPDGARCLVGHAEDWRPLAIEDTAWRRWMDDETGAAGELGLDTPPADDGDPACSPLFFAFRRARPADMDVYRARLRRQGLHAEARLGARFDRICARRGVPAAVRMVKARAGRAFTPSLAPRPARLRRPWEVDASR